MVNIKRLGFVVIITILAFVMLGACDDVSQIALTFDANGGEFSNDSETYTMNIESEADLVLPSNPTRDGYVFDGWYLDNENYNNEFSVETLSDSVVQAELTIYAKWAEEGTQDTTTTTYTLTFETNGGSSISPITIEEGATITIPTAPVKTGYTFDGWYLDNTTFTQSASSIFTNGITENTTLYAKWVEEGTQDPTTTTYTLTFNTNGGNSISPITVEEETAITIPSAPEKTDYTFDGWYLDNTTFTQSANTVFANGITEDVTIYAKWTPQEPQATEGLVFNLKGDSTYEVTDYTGSDLDVYVPGTYMDTDVTSIAYNAFDGTTIDSLTLGENITEIEYIGSGTQLESLHLPSSLTTMDDGIYIYQTLTEVTVSENSTLYSSSNGVLFDKAMEELVMYPVAKGASYTVPDGVLRIGESCFRHNTVLTSITLPDSLIEIEFGAFWLTQNLTSIVIPNNVTTIGNNAFFYSGIESVTLGNNVSYIGYNAFAGSDITSITIPASVTEIGVEAFASCIDLESVTVQATTPPTADQNCFRSEILGQYNEGLNIYVPSSSVSAYQTATNWSDYSEIISAIPS